MVSKIEPNRKQGGTKRILAAIAIIATALFLLAAAAPAAAPESSMQPASTTQNYTPAPTMNTNVTWSTFNSAWSPLEYTNGTANQSLNADMSSFYANPISINTADVVANGTLQNDSFAGTVWDATAQTAVGTFAKGTATSSTLTTIDGVKERTITANLSEAGTSIICTQNTASLSQLPSNNPQYDYVTVGMLFTGPPVTGAIGKLNIYNGSNTISGVKPMSGLTPGQAVYFSQNLAQIEQENGYSTGLNTTGKGALSQLNLQFTLSLPAGPSADTFTLTLFALALTTYPIILGTNSTGKTPDQFTGNALLSNFHPTSPMQVVNDGYSVAVSQPMQNITEQQTSINDGSYTEQATYQGIFSLPTAPDLSYSASNITVPLTINGNQYEVANLNGASYLSSIETHTNGTFSFGIVNPNSQNSIVLEVKYTTSQWDASSSAPSFFTLAGIEYYWWVAVLGVMGLIGLGSIAISHFGGEEETLRVPKGKYGR